MSAKKKLEKYWVDISKIMGAGIDAVSGHGLAGMVAKVAAAGREAAKEDGVSDNLPSVKGVPLAPNPHFIDNGHGGPSMQYTAKYINQRVAKKIGGEVFELAGAVTSAATVVPVNVASLAKHGSASVSTVMHLYHLMGMANSVKGSVYLSSLLDVLVQMKMAKAVIRTGDIVASAAGGVFGKVLSMAMRTCKIAGKEVMGEITAYTAQELHWRAYQEQKLAAVFGGTGPASRMVEEILTRRIHRFLGGQYNWKGIVNEPAGWIVLKDKIAMI